MHSPWSRGAGGLGWESKSMVLARRESFPICQIGGVSVLAQLLPRCD